MLVREEMCESKKKGIKERVREKINKNNKRYFFVINKRTHVQTKNP